MIHTATFVIKSAIDGTSIVNALFGYFLIYFPLVQTRNTFFPIFHSMYKNEFAIERDTSGYRHVFKIAIVY